MFEPYPRSPGRRTVRVAAAFVAGLALISCGRLAHASPETASQRAQEAGTALVRGDLQAAVDLYTEALKEPSLSNERRATLLGDRGLAHGRLNRVRQAIDDFNKSLTLYPENAATYNNRGALLIALNQPVEAVKDLDRAILLSPGYAPAYNNRANAYAKLGQHALAIKDFTQAISLTSSSAVPLAGRGVSNLAANRPHAALRDFTKAITIDQKFAAAYARRAEALLAIDRVSEAIEDLSRAVDLAPNKNEFLVARGKAFLAAKDYQAALKDFSKVIDGDPRSVNAFTFRGVANARLSQHEDALNDFAKAIEIDYRSVNAYVERAATYRQMGQPETGLRDIDRALKLDPQAAEPYRVRAQLYEAIGRADEAVQDYRQAVVIDPGLREGWEALDRLTGEARPQNQAVPSAGSGEWRVFLRPSGSYFALNDRYPRLSVPLETIGEGAPRVVAFEVQPAPLQEIAVLKFEAGTIAGAEGGEPTVQAAVLDLTGASVVALVPDRIGKAEAKWTWDEGKITIAAADGLSTDYVVRDRAGLRQVRTATGRLQRDPNNPETWVPWANQRGDRPSERRAQGGGKPKSLFDLFFKF